MKKGIAVLLILAVALPVTLLVVSGCGTPTPAEARAQLETDLQTLETSLTGLLNPTTYSSKDSFNKAADDIKSSFNDVVKSAKQVANIETADLQDAWDQLEKAITSDKPLTEKLVDIQDSAKNFQTAWQDLVDKVNSSK